MSQVMNWGDVTPALKKLLDDAAIEFWSILQSHSLDGNDCQQLKERSTHQVSSEVIGLIVKSGSTHLGEEDKAGEMDLLREAGALSRQLNGRLRRILLAETAAYTKDAWGSPATDFAVSFYKNGQIDLSDIVAELSLISTIIDRQLKEESARAKSRLPADREKTRQRVLSLAHLWRDARGTLPVGNAGGPLSAFVRLVQE